MPSSPANSFAPPDPDHCHLIRTSLSIAVVSPSRVAGRIHRRWVASCSGGVMELSGCNRKIATLSAYRVLPLMFASCCVADEPGKSGVRLRLRDSPCMSGPSAILGARPVVASCPSALTVGRLADVRRLSPRLASSFRSWHIRRLESRRPFATHRPDFAATRGLVRPSPLSLGSCRLSHLTTGRG